MTSEWPDVIYEDILDADVLDIQGSCETPIVFFPVQVSDQVAPNELRVANRDTGEILYQRFFDSEDEFNSFMDLHEE